MKPVEGDKDDDQDHEMNTPTHDDTMMKQDET